MSEQDPLSTYSLWAKQASILEDLDEGDSTTTIKPNGVYIANEKENKKEDMDERRQKYGSNGRGDSGNGGGGGVKPRRALSRRRLVPSSEEDPIMVRLNSSITRVGYQAWILKAELCLRKFTDCFQVGAPPIEVQRKLVHQNPELGCISPSPSG